MSKIDRDQLEAALIDFALFRPEDVPMPLRPEHRAESGAEPGDETAELMSEGMLYPLFGKEDARSVRAYFHALVEAAGLPREVWRDKLAAARRARTRVALDVAVDGWEGRRRALALLGPTARRLRGNLRMANERTGPAVRMIELAIEDADFVRARLEAHGYEVTERGRRLLARWETCESDAAEMDGLC